MLYVLDASVAAKWFLPETDSDKARVLLYELIHQNVALLAPDVLVPELGDALWKRVLRGDISLSEARQSYSDFLNLNIQLESSPVIAMQSLDLASRMKHPLYDALYVVATRHNCEFVTADRALVNKLGASIPLIRWLGSL